MIKLEYDLYYIKNLALSLDIYIVFQTVKTVLFGRGAQESGRPRKMPCRM